MQAWVGSRQTDVGFCVLKKFQPLERVVLRLIACLIAFPLSSMADTSYWDTQIKYDTGSGCGSFGAASSDSLGAKDIAATFQVCGAGFNAFSDNNMWSDNSYFIYKVTGQDRGPDYASANLTRSGGSGNDHYFGWNDTLSINLLDNITYNGTYTFDYYYQFRDDGGTHDTVHFTPTFSVTGTNWYYDLSSDLTVSDDLGGDGAYLLKKGSGALTLTGDNTYSGGARIEGGSVIIAESSDLGATPASTVADYIQLSNWAMLRTSGSFSLDSKNGIALTGNGSIRVDDSCTLSYSGDITGGNEFSKTGAGTLELGTESDITASEIYIDEGVLWVKQTQPFDGTATTIHLGSDGGSGSATLKLGSASTTKTMDEQITVRAGDDTKSIENGNTGGNCTFAGKINLHDDLTVTAVGGSTVVLGGGVDMSANGDNNSDLTISGADNVTISGVIEADGGAADLNHNGTGILELGGDNATDVENWMKVNVGGGGVLQISDKKNLGDAPVALYADKLNFHSDGGTLYNTADVDLNSYFGISLANGVSAVFEVGDGSADDLKVEGEIWDGDANNGQLVKSGPGTLWLLGANSYGGATFISNGVVRITNDSGLGTAPSSETDGHLTINGGGLLAGSSASLAANRNIAIGADGAVVDALSSQTLTINGKIKGTGNLSKSSSGSVVLAGENTFVGTTTIAGGTLKVSADSGLGADPGTPAAASITLNGGTLQATADMTLDSDRGITLAGAGTLVVDASRTLTYAGRITGEHGLTKDGAGKLILTGANDYSGETIVSSGILQGDTTGLQRDVTVDSGTMIIFDQAEAGTYSDVISGDGSLTKSGAGNVTLSGENTYNGASTISSGTLTVSGSAANSDITVVNGATLAGDGPVKALVLSGTVSPKDADSVGTLACSALTLNAGGSFICHIGDASDTSDRDVLDVNSGAGTVTINASSGSRFTIYLSDVALSNWDADTSNDWIIVRAGALSTFSADKFAVDSTTYWSTSLGGGTFSLREENDVMVLTFEPGSTAPILIDPTNADIAATTATLGATLQDNGGETVTDFGVVWSTASLPETTDHKVQKSTTEPSMPCVFTVSATGLNAGTLIYYRGYGINSEGTAYSAEESFYTWSTEPSAHVTSLSFSGNEVSAGLDWNAAAGADGYLVLQRDGGVAPSGVPSDGSGYSVDDVIGDGTVVAVVTDGSTDASIDSLNRASQYAFTVIAFAWDGSHDATCNYKTGGTIPSVSGYTTAANPDSAPGNLTFSCTGFAGLTGMTISWDKGTSADYTLVVLEEGSAGIGGSPSDKTAYTANTVFGSGDVLQSGEYVVYSGDGTSVDVTGLNPDTTYTVKLWSYNGAQTETLNYRTSDSLTGSQSTVAPAQAQNPTEETNPTTAWLGDSLDLHVNAWFLWVGNNRTAATVFYRWADADLASSSLAGNWRDPGHAANDAYATTPVLSQVATFYYALRISYDSGNDFYYWEDDESWHDMSLSLPSAAEHSIVVSALNDPSAPGASRSGSSPSSEIDLSWTKTDGHGVMIVRKLSTASWTEPVQGTPYGVSDSLGEGTVVYNSADAETVSDGDLTAGTTYTYKFYSVNNDYYSAGVTAQATTRGLASATWDGGTDSSMMTAENWSTDAAPGTGSDVNLYFPSGAARYTPNNDFDANSDFGGLFFDSTAEYTFSGNAFQLYEKLENSNTATVTVSANITLNGETKTEINPVGGDIRLSGTVSLSGKNLEVHGDNENTLFVDQIISGNSDVYVKQNSIVEIAADCTYYDTYVQAGEVRVMEGGDAGAGTRTVTVGSDASLGTDAAFYIGDADGGTTVNQALAIAAGSSADNRVMGSRNSSGVNIYADTVTLAGDVTIDVTQSGGQCMFNQPVTDGDATCKVVKDGPGIAVLGAVNTYSGNTEIDEGQLWIGDNASLEDGTTIYLGHGGATSTETTLLISDTLAGLTVNEDIVVNSGDDYSKRVIGAKASTGDNVFSGDVTLNGDVSLAAAGGGTLKMSGAITGAKDVYVTDAGTVHLSGVNTYSGGKTVVNAGTLEVSGGSAIPDASAVTLAVGSELLLTGNSETVGSLEGAGNINLGASRTLSLGNPSGTKTLSGTISSSSGGALTYAGADDTDACLVLQGANTYAGAVVVNSGNLQVESDTGLGSVAGGVDVKSGAQLRLNNGISVGDEALTLRGDGSTANGSANGALRNVAGANQWQGVITCSDNSLVYLDAGSLTLSGSLDFNENTFWVDGGDGTELILSGAILNGSKKTAAVDHGALRKEGTGLTLTLSAANPGLTGDIYFEEGTIKMNHAGALGSAQLHADRTQTAAACVLDVGSGVAGDISLTGGILVDKDFHINNSTIHKVTVSGGNVAFTHESGAVFKPNTSVNADMEISSAITDGTTSQLSSLSKFGDGKLILSGQSTFTGPVYINAGTVAVHNAGNPLQTKGIYLGSSDDDWDATLEVSDGTTMTNLVVTRSSSHGSGQGLLSVQNLSGSAELCGELKLAYSPTTVGQEVRLIGSGSSFELSGGMNLVGDQRGVHVIGKVLVSGAITNGTGDTYNGLVKRGSGTLEMDGLLGVNFYQDEGNVVIGSNCTFDGVASYYLGTRDNPAFATGNTFLTFQHAQVFTNGITVGTLDSSDVIGTRQINFEHTNGLVKVSGPIVLGTHENRFLILSNDTANAELSGDISVSGGLIKQGAGTITFSANATYTDETRVEEGTLLLNHINNSATLSVCGGASLMGRDQWGLCLSQEPFVPEVHRCPPEPWDALR
ncbi:MAG: hypothetical protein EOL87_14130 [Spartobacteria bacterium]|nr:hypothetical protein [Spartobacteria bacterium]